MDEYDEPSRVLRFPAGRKAPEPVDDDLTPPDDGDDDEQLRVRPYPGPVDGRDVFDSLVDKLTRFARLPEGAAVIIAVWIIHTWAIYRCRQRTSPRIVVAAPTLESGKTTLMRLIAEMVREAAGSSEPSPASVYEMMTTKHTVLLDECQALRRNSKVWVHVDAGHTRSPLATVRRSGRHHRIFGPVIVAGNPRDNGDDFAPSTTVSRGWKFKLRRMMADETIESFDPAEHGDMMTELQSKIYRWVLDKTVDIRNCRPAGLDRYALRLRDNVLPLLQIADVIGVGDQLRDAIDLHSDRDAIINPLEQFLRDVAEIMLDPDVRVGDPPQPIGDFVFSSDLVALLRENPHYESISFKVVHSRLKQFDIVDTKQRRKPGRAHVQMHGWPRAAFDDAFRRFAKIDPSAGSPAHRDPPDMAEYPCAVRVMPVKRDTGRDTKLREAIEATKLGAFWFSPERVRFVCPFFWVVQNAAGIDVFWHMADGELETRGIDAERGIVADPPGQVAVNASTVIKLGDAEWPRWAACIGHFYTAVPRGATAARPPEIERIGDSPQTPPDPPSTSLPVEHASRSATVGVAPAGLPLAEREGEARPVEDTAPVNDGAEPEHLALITGSHVDGGRYWQVLRVSQAGREALSYFHPSHADALRSGKRLSKKHKLQLVDESGGP